jgi:hypothetical protein
MISLSRFGSTLPEDSAGNRLELVRRQRKITALELLVRNFILLLDGLAAMQFPKGRSPMA